MDCCMRVRSRESANRIADLGLLIKMLATLLIIISAFLIILDVSALIDVKNDTENYNEFGMQIPALCGMIILFTHFIITLIHLCNGFSLFRSIDERNFIKCRKWYLKSTPFLCVESLNIFLFLIFGTTATYFVVFANLGVTYKLYMLWPVKRYILSIRNYTTNFMANNEPK